MADFKERRCDRKKRKVGSLPPDRLRRILYRIYPENIAEDLIKRFEETRTQKEGK